MTSEEFAKQLVGHGPFNPNPPANHSAHDLAEFSYELHKLLFIEFEGLLRPLRAGNIKLVQDWCEIRLQNLLENKVILKSEKDSISKLQSSILAVKETTLHPDLHSHFVTEAKRIEQTPNATITGAMLASIARSSADQNLGAASPGGATPMGIILGADVAGALGAASIGRLAIVLSPWGYAAAIGLGAAICSGAAAF